LSYEFFFALCQGLLASDTQALRNVMRQGLIIQVRRNFQAEPIHTGFSLECISVRHVLHLKIDLFNLNL
jgi:hypothetical protein